MSSFYTPDELFTLGFKDVKSDALVSRKASFYGIENIVIGNKVRIDDFCILSGDIQLGSYIHISAYCALYGAKGIVMDDYTGLSPRCTVFSATDDFSGESLIGPMCPNNLTNVIGGTVFIQKYSQVGAGCIIMPGVTIEEGTVVGAMSLVKDNLSSWGVYAGIPTKRIKERNRSLLSLIEKDKLK